MKKIAILLMAIISFLASSAQETLIDAAFMLNNQFGYFIKDDKVVKYDFKADKAVETTYLSQNAFPGVTFSKIDAAFNVNNKIYFFSNQKYIRFNPLTFSADVGYPKLTQAWALGFISIDAVLNWNNGKSYFFNQTNYSRYNNSTATTDEGYPRQTTSSLWPGLTFSEIDAAISLPNGKSYFFRGNQYVRYDQKTDVADPGYPKPVNSSTWPGLLEALKTGKTTNNDDDDNVVNNSGNLTVTKYTTTVSPQIKDPSSILCSHYITPTPDGGFYLIYPNESDVYVQKFNSNIQKSGNPLVLRNYWFSDVIVHNDASVAFLLGRSVNNTYLGKYPNSIYFLKMDKNGNLGSPKLIFGENAHSAGESWFDGRSKGKINYNGTEYGFYFEVQKNWAKAGEADDIHNGDMFVVTDLQGNKKPNRDHFWTASHSNTVHITSEPNGNFFTLTSGDAYPFGLQFYNRNTSFNKVVWPPKEDHVPYAECNSSAAAGLIRYLDAVNGEILAIVGTLEHPNIGWKSKVDPMFLKFDTQGNITKRTWLAQTPTADDSNITVFKTSHNKYWVAWSGGNVYENNYKADNIKLAQIDANGNFTQKLKEHQFPFGTYSQLIELKDGRLVWVNVEGYSPSENIEIYVGTFK